MKILGIIPARKGSKRIKNKNIKLLAGKPLIEYVLKAAAGSKLLTDIVVSSDSSKVLEIASKYKKIIPLKRPAEISTDSSLPIEYVKHALNYLNVENKKYDIIVIIQPTSPLIKPGDIDKTIETLIKTKADTAVSVVKIGHSIHPEKMKIIKKNILYPLFKEFKSENYMAAKMKNVYVRNAAIYATTFSTIKKNKIIGNKCSAYVMPEERSIDINTLVDFKLANLLLKK